MVLACCSVFSRPAPRLLSLSPRQPLAAMELSLTGNSQSVLPPPLPTLLLLSARRGVRRRRISPSPAAYPPLHSARTAASRAARAERRRREERHGWHAAMGGAEQHAAAGERSSAGGPSGARGRLVAVGYVSVREFLASLFRDTRTRRGYVSRPYPKRIRVGYVSDTGYAPSLPYPCF